MDNCAKLEAIRLLVHVGLDHAELVDPMLEAIGKVFGLGLVVQEPQVNRNGQGTFLHDPTLNEIVTALRGNKIAAIKLYRERTGLGLKDAKDNVEKAMDLARDAVANCTYSTPYYDPMRF